MGAIKKLINSIPSSKTRKLLRPVYYFFLYQYRRVLRIPENKKLSKLHLLHTRAIQKLKNRQNEKICVLFIVLNASIWKYNELYLLLEKHPRLNPLIAICPHTGLNDDLSSRELAYSYNIFSDKGFNVVNTFDEEKGIWIDLLEKYSPGFVFFTNPHNLSKPQYLIKHFESVLTCYAPYSVFATNKPRLQFDQYFQNALWRIFYESKLHKDLAVKYARNNGANVVVSGSLMYDVLAVNKPNGKSWKNNSKSRKKIIYAPHHTFNSMEEINFSTFLENGELLLHLAEKYLEQVQVAFKPHPLLKSKLYDYEGWGRDKTDYYYSRWSELPNTQIEEGDYVNLFIESDALVMDSISFMTEYAFTGKPSMFLMRNKKMVKYFNPYGKMLLNELYLGFSPTDIESFFTMTINGEDPRKDHRNKFISTYLKPPNNQSAAENILYNICEAIDLKDN